MNVMTGYVSQDSDASTQQALTYVCGPLVIKDTPAILRTTSVKVSTGRCIYGYQRLKTFLKFG